MIGFLPSGQCPLRNGRHTDYIDGRRAAVGTPGYGAPEQMERGEATEASDIHALGVLADRCFDGRPPRTWKRIVERATSSIPAHPPGFRVWDFTGSYDGAYNKVRFGGPETVNELMEQIAEDQTRGMQDMTP